VAARHRVAAPNLLLVSDCTWPVEVFAFWPLYTIPAGWNNWLKPPLRHSATD
jgi:hypothetical protein